MDKLLRNQTLVFPLLILIVGIPLMMYGERFPVHDGWGYDGNNYGRWATDFEGTVLNKKLEAYYVGRTLPSAIVHYTMRAAGVKFTHLSVVRAFQIWDLLVLVIAAILWARVVALMRIRDKAAWFGFLGLFVNFPFLKSTLYNPLTLNPSALALGMGLLLCYLKRNQIGVVAVCVVGAFIWPTVLPTGLLLFVFPRRRDLEPPPGAAEPAPYGLAALAGFAAVGGALWLVNHFAYGNDPTWPRLAPHINTDLFYLSAVCMVVFVYFSVSRLVDSRSLYSARNYVTFERTEVLWFVGRLILAIALYKTAKWIYATLGPRGTGPTLRFYYVQVTFGALVRPAQFVLGHITLFGPLVIFMLLRWKRMCAKVHELGPGLTLFLGTLLLQGINAQSRQLIHYYPFLVALVVMACDDDFERFSTRLFGALCFLYSKIWFPINLVAIPTQSKPRAWPLQRFLMSHGSWMNQTMYIVQGAFVLVTILYVHRRITEPRPPP